MRGGEAAGPTTQVPHRGMLTLSIMLANIMQGLDNTILNVSLPHIQGSLSTSQDQIAWALTSYIVCAAVMMPLTGWLAGRFGIKPVFLICIGVFTTASALCGMATSLSQLVTFRAIQGMAGAGLIPLAQATLLRINPPERHGTAMAIFGTGTVLGPMMGPVLGGWFTEYYSWRYVFYLNLPIGILCSIGILTFMRWTPNPRREAFDFFGFFTLSIAVGVFQLMLDRGTRNDWFSSTETWIEATIAGLALYLFIVHTVTTTGPSFLNRELLKSGNFVAGTLMMFAVGLIMTGCLALLPMMLQHLMHYPAFTTGLVTAPRGLGVMIAMFMVGRLINRIDSRLLILVGFLLTAVSMWQMTQFSLLMDPVPVVISGLLQGFGLGCTFVPLNTLALSTLPRNILTQGTALRSLMRNLGGSIGISMLVSQLSANTQTVHARLVEHLRPDNPLLQAPFLPAPWNLNTLEGIARLNAEVTRQAAMVAYTLDFQLMMGAALAVLPLLLLIRNPKRLPPPPRAAPAPAGADD
ncbi:MAG: DHA2 family efflux MFS transporter permease subunit [Alphaproteobacteria bacterium]